MKKLAKFYRRNRIDILNILNLLFCFLACSVIVFYLLPLEGDGKYNATSLLIALATAIILLFTVIESNKANRLQVSSHFYEQKLKDIGKLKMNKGLSFTEASKIMKVFHIKVEKDISYTAFSNFLPGISKDLERDAKRIELINKGEFKDSLSSMNDFLAFYDNEYLPALHEIGRIKVKIDKLYNMKSLVLQHHELLYNILYEYIFDFMVFSRALLCGSHLYNPIIETLDNRYNKVDFFDSKRVRLISDEFNEIISVSEA